MKLDSVIIESTAALSWGQLWKACNVVKDSKSLVSVDLHVVMVMCLGKECSANHFDCASQNFRGMYLVAQS